MDWTPGLYCAYPQDFYYLIIVDERVEPLGKNDRKKNFAMVDLNKKHDYRFEVIGFTTRRQILDLHDVRGTLAVENNEKVIYRK